MDKTLCITMDLDPLSCYSRLYGLPDVANATDPVLTKAPERLAQLLDPIGAKATFFVVGNTLEQHEHASAIAGMARQGFEISNHTWSHPYELSRMAPAEIDAEIYRGAQAIEKICGQAPVGFRAPGYLLGQHVLGRLILQHVAYDASVLPSPGYQAIKAFAMALLKIGNKNTSAILGDPRESLAPSAPYRPDSEKPWRRGTAKLVELPISRLGPLPLTGSVLSLTQRAGAWFLARSLSRNDFVHLELHGVDLLDINSDGIDPALATQPDLRISWKRKASAIGAFISELVRTHEPVTLWQAADRYRIG